MGKLVKTVYGDALFEYAKENDCMKEWMKEIHFVKKVLTEHPDFHQMMGHPRIERREKIKVLETVFEGRIPEQLLGFLVLTTKKNHFHQLGDIFDHFEKCYRDYYNMGMAKVSTAMELSDTQKKRIYERLLETTTYDTIEMEYQVDASLLGGIVIRMNDRVVDGSVRKKLYTLTSMLRKVQLGEK